MIQASYRGRPTVHARLIITALLRPELLGVLSIRATLLERWSQRPVSFDAESFPIVLA